MLAARSLVDIAERFGGTLWCRDGLAAAPHHHYSGVAIDSRAVAAGELFIAVVGERLDGHDFTSDASLRAAALVVDSPQPESPLLQWVVEDTTVALGQLAGLEREQFNYPVIALTGSSGKSSVKEFCAAILSLSAPTLATAGNLNNQFGAPLTLLGLSPAHRFAVIELGASRPGDIESLAALANADVVLVNNIQPAHIEGFGSLAAIAQEKSAIYRQLSTAGTAVVNLDEPFAAGWLRELGQQRVVSFSRNNPSADFSAADIELVANGCAQFTLVNAAGKVAVALRSPGLHQVSNALAAAALASAAGCSLELIGRGLSGAQMLPGRLTVEVLSERVTLIDDSYNANPGSVAAAIDLLAAMDGLRFLVLGDMAELGDSAVQWHQQIGRYAAQQAIDGLFAVGELSALAAREADGTPCASQAECLQELLAIVAQASAVTILVKGSRSAGMDKLCAQLRAEVTG